MISNENSKKLAVPILMFVFCEFIYRQHIVKYIFFNDFLVVSLFGNSILDKNISFGVLNFVVAGIVLLISKFLFNGKLTSVDYSKKMNIKKTILIVFLFLILSVFLFHTIMYVIYNIFHMSINSLNSENLMKIDNQNEYISMIVMFFTVIFEEVVYRKLLFGCLYDLHKGCNKYVEFMTAAIASSIIFGAIHDGVFNLAMISYVVASMLITVVYFYTKRISAAIAVHFLFNIYLQVINNI
ncbi:CAAX amino terminal protease family protein [Parvimonas sp. oral taxon 110 str. F0139]|nr:CAAX amino terminal protease family protein [Parvimonas sp. oral taxon 110 str. F0139]